MPESWFALSREDQAEALEVAAASTGRAPHLLEKDTWVVWTLSAIYESALAERLTFKGGTSLSKVYKIIVVLRGIVLKFRALRRENQLIRILC